MVYPEQLLMMREGMKRFWDGNFTDCVFLAQAFSTHLPTKFVKLPLDRAAWLMRMALSRARPRPMWSA